jgi:hypothetical protein
VVFHPVEARTHIGKQLEHTDMFVKIHTSAGVLYVLALRIKPSVRVFGKMFRKEVLSFLCIGIIMKGL